LTNPLLRVLKYPMLYALIGSSSFAADFAPTKVKLETALAMNYRSIENQDRDENRNPVAAMEFCRLRDNMTVIEFGPGAGWYTEILGPVLREKGRLLIAYKESWMERLDTLLAQDYMSAVEKHPIDISWNSEKQKFNIGNIVYDVENFVTFTLLLASFWKVQSPAYLVKRTTSGCSG